MVTVLLEVGWNSGTGSGNLKITGLPFATTRNVVEALGASSCSWSFTLTPLYIHIGVTPVDRIQVKCLTKCMHDKF